MCRKQKRQLYLQTVLDPDDDEGGCTYQELQAGEDLLDQALSRTSVLAVLESVKGEYRGVALLGIEALELKIKGFSGGEIALLYGVQPNVVGAWISRAAEKLRSNQRFIARL